MIDIKTAKKLTRQAGLVGKVHFEEHVISIFKDAWRLVYRDEGREAVAFRFYHVFWNGECYKSRGYDDNKFEYRMPDGTFKAFGIEEILEAWKEGGDPYPAQGEQAGGDA